MAVVAYPPVTADPLRCTQMNAVLMLNRDENKNGKLMALPWLSMALGSQTIPIEMHNRYKKYPSVQTWSICVPSFI